MMQVGVVQNDIPQVDCDAIVNAANSSLLGGGGVDGAIHRAAGPELLAACRAVVARQGGCPAGDAVITAAGNLAARYVIHTVGPVWVEGQAAKLDPLLASCYTRSLDLAIEHDITSIAFPNISTGVYRYPKQRAAQIAIDTVRMRLDEVADTCALTRVLFVCFDEENLEIYNRLLL